MEISAHMRRQLVFRDDLNIDPATQALLSADPDIEIRTRLASRSDLDPALEAIFGADPFDAVRRQIAFRTSDPTLIGAFATDTSSIVHSALANSKHLPHEIQEGLLADSDEIVRYILVENSAFSPDLQVKIANTPDSTTLWDLKNALIDNPNIAEDAQVSPLTDSSEFPVTARFLAEHPSLAPKAQELILNSNDVQTRKALAANPTITTETQPALSKDTNAKVLKALAKNPSLKWSPDLAANFVQKHNYPYYVAVVYGISAPTNAHTTSLADVAAAHRSSSE